MSKPSQPENNAPIDAPPESDLSTDNTNTQSTVDTITSIVASSTVDEINKMNIAIARSEYPRLSTDKAITLEKVMTISATAIYDDLKRFRNRISQISSLTQYQLTSNTPDNVIEELNRDRCIYSLSQYCVQQGVQVDQTFDSSMSHFQLRVEVTRARDQLKSPLPPNESNPTGIRATQQRPKTTSDKKPTNSTQKNKPRATPRELAVNLNGANASEFDPFKSKPSHDVRGPPKAPSDEDDVDEGHDVVSAERTIKHFMQS